MANPGIEPAKFTIQRYGPNWFLYSGKRLLGIWLSATKNIVRPKEIPPDATPIRGTAAQKEFSRETKRFPGVQWFLKRTAVPKPTRAPLPGGLVKFRFRLPQRKPAMGKT